MAALEQKTITSNDHSRVSDRNGENTLESLMKRIQGEPEYPAISQHISEITQKSAPENPADTNELSAAILNDYALTTKLLKMVNSASFTQYGGQISTISRAIVILGFEQVRAAALSILLFDHLNSAEQADALKDASCSAFMSGILARKISGEFEIEPEQAFITSLFHKLGKQMAIYYFAEEYKNIENLLDITDLREEAACKKELGVTYPDLGKAIAREWQLPESIIIGMQPPKVSKSRLTPDQLNAHLANCSNEIAAAAIKGQQGELSSKNFRLIADRYKYLFNLDSAQICEMVEESIPELSAYAEILQSNMTSSDYYKKLTNTAVETQATNQAKSESSEQSASSDSSKSNQEDQQADKAPEKEADPMMLIDAFTEISNTMLGDYQLNDLINMIMETIYRGMGFERVVFCLRDTRKKLMVARFGLGQDIDTIIPKFQYPISGGNDLFNLAVSKHRNFLIIDSSSEKYQGQVPAWCKTLTDPHSLVVFPIIVNKNCIGLLYADTQNVDTTFSVDVIKMFGSLRNQAALAIQQKRAGK